MRKLLPFILILLLGSTASAQYSLTSIYLREPDRAVGYVDSCAQLWLRAYDPGYGGFYTYVDRTGNPSSTSNKDMLSETRDAYGMTRAFMMTGNMNYLTYAKSALQFMYAHAWDQVHDGWYSTIGRTGTPLNPSESKEAFDQLYALLGISAHYEATRDSLDWQWLMKGYASNDKHLWDSRPAYQGYYNAASSDWASRTGKSFNATVDALTTHAFALYLLHPDSLFRARMLALGDNMLNRIAPTTEQQAIGMVEWYDADWNWSNDPTANNPYNTRTIMGHVLKTAWCLARMHQIVPDTTYIITAEQLVDSVLTKGYDHQFGGPYKDYDRVTGTMMMYGADTAKAWWQMEQAVVAGLQLYEVTRKEKYLQMADETLRFYMTYFVDHQYGDVYADRTKWGDEVPGWGLGKGNHSKAAYHSIELGYYVYLYGKLFLQKQPVLLHYDFQPAPLARTLRLEPLEYDPSKYVISGVSLNGVPSTSFDAVAHTLSLAAGEGGHAQVTFAPASGAPPLIVMNSARCDMGAISASQAYRDTSFYVTNTGGEPDSITVWLDYVNVTSDSAVDVWPKTFVLSPGASQLVTFRVYPPLLTSGNWYNTVIHLDARLAAGQRSFEKVMIFGIFGSPLAVGEGSDAPHVFRLEQNWPNPFNPATQINYTIGQRQDLGTMGGGDLGRSVLVQLTVYDILGREVKTLVNEQQAPGRYQVRFDGAGLASGVYLYRLTAGSFTETRRMVLVK